MKKAFFYSLSVLIALVLVFSSVTPASAASTIYVRTDGDDTNCNGTTNAPYPGSGGPGLDCAVKTIQKGIDLVDPAGTVYVNDGIYNENITILNKNVKLLSINGRSETTIKGISGIGSLATILVDGTTTGVQIGDVDEGFTIIGIDNDIPSVENAALYFRGNHAGAIVKGNNIQANGDHGLLSEYGATITNFVIDSNIFSGKTFIGDTPGGDGFGGQFSTPNVPRQLVVMGGGATGTLTTNIRFTNNQVTGIAGGINSDGKEQGNTLVTIDADGSLIEGNTFAGKTTRYATSLRARRPNTTIENNNFISTGLTPTTGHIFIQNNPLSEELVSSNSFDKGVYIVNPSGGTIGVGIYPFLDSGPVGSTIKVLPGVYEESKGGWRDLEIFKSLSLIGAGSGQTIVKLSGLQNGVEIRPDETGEVLIQGITFTKKDDNDTSAEFAIRVGETGGTFNSLTFKDVEVAYAGGRNVFLDGSSTVYQNVVIENCNFHYSGAWGFSARGTIGNMTVKNSSFNENGWSDPSHGIGFDLDMPNAVDNLIVENSRFNKNKSKGLNLVNITNSSSTNSAVFTNVEANENIGDPSKDQGFGIVIWEWKGKSRNLKFINPVIQNNSLDGFLIGAEGGNVVDGVEILNGVLTSNGRHGLNVYNYVDSPGSIQNIKINRSYLAGNTQKGVATNTTQVVDASGNWWGSADKNAVQASYSGNVDYTPWLNVGNDASTDPGFQGDFSTLWVDDDSPQTGTEGRIQEGIDRSSGSTVYVFPGAYIETATKRYVLGTSGPHQFGLFIGSDKQGLSLIGVDQNGVPITDYEDVGAVITTTAKNNFGYSGIFVEGDDITVQGFEIRDNLVNGSISNNKTIEVIGDNFTLRHCHVSVGAEEEDGGSIYFGDWRFDPNTNTSHIKSYTIENNWIDHGTSVDIVNGAGYSGEVSERKILNNKFTSDGDEYWPFIGFTGAGTGVPWFVHPVGGAIIRGNDFAYEYNGDDYNGVGIAHIRARGTYDNSQFDWESYWKENIFNKAVVFGPNPPTELGTYSYTSGSYTFNNVRRIGVEIATEVKQANNGHTVLAKKGTYIHPVDVNKSLVVTSEEGWEETILTSGFDIHANQVTIDGFQILTGTVSAGVDLHGIYVAGGIDNVVLKNNVLTGSWKGGKTNFVGGRGILAGYNVSNLTVENNVIEKWVSGLYLNPTNGAVTVQNNEIKNNWAGAGTDGQGNVLFKNNYFIGNIEGIGASSVGTSFTVEENAFINNVDAVNWYDGNPISAKLNWWNGNKGPVAPSNPKGNGQSISSNIEYQPWLCDGTDTQPDVLGFQPTADTAKCTNLATKLVFTQYPTGAFENIPFAQQPMVRAEDDEGNLAITFDNFIFIDIGTNPVGGLLLPGPYYKKAVDGVATFGGLYLNKAGQGYTLKAFGLGSSGDFILTEGTAFDVLKQQADLSVTVTDAPDPVNAGETLSYIVTVTNGGPHTAQGVSVSFQLPAGFTLQSAGGSGWSCNQNSGVVTCTRSALPSGQSAQFTVQGTAPTQAGSITATATVTLSEAMDDPDTANNQASATTTVVELPPTGPSHFIYLPLVMNNAAP